MSYFKLVFKQTAGTSYNTPGNVYGILADGTVVNPATTTHIATSTVVAGDVSVLVSFTQDIVSFKIIEEMYTSWRSESVEIYESLVDVPDLLNDADFNIILNAYALNYVVNDAVIDFIAISLQIEIDRRAALTQAERDAEDEVIRRAALTQAERDAEDAAILEAEAEATRRAALTQAERDAEDEVIRRAALTQAERDAEDAAILEAEELALANAVEIERNLINDIKFRAKQSKVLSLTDVLAMVLSDTSEAEAAGVVLGAGGGYFELREAGLTDAESLKALAIYNKQINTNRVDTEEALTEMSTSPALIVEFEAFLQSQTTPIPLPSLNDYMVTIRSNLEVYDLVSPWFEAKKVAEEQAIFDAAVAAGVAAALA